MPSRIQVIFNLLMFFGLAGTLQAEDSQNQISFEWLKQTIAPTSPVNTSAFVRPPQAKPADSSFSGQLELSTGKTPTYFKLLKDSFKTTKSQSARIAELPRIAFNFVQTGDNIVPEIRSLITGDHPYWEWLVGPGKIWVYAADPGFYRIALPLSLQEKNANCTHNGYLLILLQKNGGSGPGLLQITAETCGYLQFDMVAKMDVAFTPKAIARQDELINEFKLERQNRLPSFTINELTKDYPQLDINTLLGTKQRQAITSGLVINGKHYRLHCGGRYGPEPYCDELALPSYSTAKSIFAGIALMRMEAKYPGVGNIAVTRVIPECADTLWRGVSLNHLLNMRSGNYRSRKAEADEASERMVDFFVATSHAEKLELACNMFPRKTKPGKHFVYHTSDTYLAGVMLNRLYQRFEGKTDIYTDWFAADLWKDLGLSPLLATTKRTYDKVKQPLTGVGLTYNIDDIIKISQFLFSQLETSTPILDRKLLANALQRDPVSLNFVGDSPELAYNSGFWALEVSKSLGCKNPRWIPFMSGYGGITIALISPELMYYNYADDYQYRWLAVVKELGRQFDLCEE
ncbi:MAG: hypothetical protein L3J24_09840 [Xanthomonadales bacterium]|nr:hypothetical protein [Xanthomonadales bacterium]